MVFGYPLWFLDVLFLISESQRTKEKRFVERENNQRSGSMVPETPFKHTLIPDWSMLYISFGQSAICLVNIYSALLLFTQLMVWLAQLSKHQIFPNEKVLADQVCSGHCMKRSKKRNEAYDHKIIIRFHFNSSIMFRRPSFVKIST